MNFPDRIMNYIKARIKEEEDDPEYKNWWKGLLIFTKKREREGRKGGKERERALCTHRGPVQDRDAFAA
jgi:hypothetical protein